MKSLGSFSLVCCLLIVLGMLLSGFGVPDSGKTLCPSAVVNGETFGNDGEKFLPEADTDFYTLISADTGFAPHLVTLVPFPCIRNNRTGSTRSSGWLMPTRI